MQSMNWRLKGDHKGLPLPTIINSHPYPVGAPLVGAHYSIGTRNTIGEMVGAFKSLTTSEYIRNVKQNNWPRFNKKMWQRNFYEHIIRNEKTFHQLSEYIQLNPRKWPKDKYHVY